MKSVVHLASAFATGVLFLAVMSAKAYWLNILSDDFSTGTGTWAYAGVSNALNQPMISFDPVQENIHVEWDQSNFYAGIADPYTIVPSCFSRALDRVVTDNDTVRFGVTLNIATGTVVDTSEIFQIASIALCDVAQMGPDRPMSDNWSTNTTRLRDGSDFLEFSYFINNSWGGPNITAVMGAHITGVDGDYTTGIDYLQTAMGEGHWLPEGTNLYIQMEYFGAETGTMARVAHCAIYTEPQRTNFLVVNSVTMSYWTQPLAVGKNFRLTQLAFYNYPSANWGGANGAGEGSFDDVYVEQYFANGEVFCTAAQGEQLISTWAAASGTTYTVQFSSNLTGSVWVTNAVIEATGQTVTYTNSPGGKGGYYRVSY